jgi:hypothetical protein
MSKSASAGDWRGLRITYNAAISRLLHLLSFRGEVNSLDEPASPESAIFINEFALKRSTAIYSK